METTIFEKINLALFFCSQLMISILSIWLGLNLADLVLNLRNHDDTAIFYILKIIIGILFVPGTYSILSRLNYFLFEVTNKIIRIEKRVLSPLGTAKLGTAKNSNKCWNLNKGNIMTLNDVFDFLMLITVFILISRVSRIEKYLSELQNSIDKQSKNK